VIQEKIAMSNTRRSILGFGLRSLTTIGAASLLKNVALASPAGGAGQVLVAIHLIGGNDSNNMIVPTEAGEYEAYARGRGELAIPRNSLLTVTSATGRGTYGLHPNLADLRRIYDEGALAIVANVGSLAAPVTRANILAHQAQLPKDLFQHSSNDRSRFVRPGFLLPSWTGAIQQSIGDEPEFYFFSSGLTVLPAERLGLEGADIDNGAMMRAIAAAPRLRTAFPDTGLGLQLKQVAALLQVSDALGLSRPVFSTSLAGFDTHHDQLPRQAELFTILSQAMTAFYEATRELGIADRVTTYTDSEFNRTLAPNATHGSEHGWGGHQLVMGGSIRGGDIIGELPSMELGGANDAGTRGVWIPSTAYHQFQAAMAGRYGIQNADLARVLPGMQNFAAASLQL
jgi:uncharacterized protein (DUF1501 family)